ncbi:MAG: hypothetical protein IPO66_11180 [Rhodanobacteraceae bacterium]|nr:hypothetical protein [Rhodanobacteraceae bacterium]
MVVPLSVPPVGLLPIASVMLPVYPVRLPKASSACTVMAGLIAAPPAVLVGCCRKASCAGAAGVMLKVFDVAPVRLGLLAASV